MGNQLNISEDKFKSDLHFHTGDETVSDLSKQAMIQDLASTYRNEISSQSYDNMKSIVPSRDCVEVSLQDGTVIRDFGDRILAPYNPTAATYSVLQDMCDIRKIDEHDVTIEGDHEFKRAVATSMKPDFTSPEAQKFFQSQNLDDPELDQIEVVGLDEQSKPAVKKKPSFGVN